MNGDIKNIKEAEEFGLGFNCMSRLYMRRYDQNKKTWINFQSELRDEMIARE